MKSATSQQDTAKILDGLKDFQRATVEYVYRRLYEDPDRVDRFLIADEVGLGKTLVARGVIAKAVDKLRLTGVRRIDIIYICANRDIARQNINRLNITGQQDVAIATRMTLLPLYLHNLHHNLINFVSFTPETSFDLRSRGGTMEERSLLYHLLRQAWGFGDNAGPKNLFQVTASYTSWREQLANFQPKDVDLQLREIFVGTARQATDLQQRFEELVERFGRHRQRGNIPEEDRADQLALIGALRRLLAKSCVGALEPDIVILDEFQRFKNLLETEDEMALLAQELFNYEGAKTLLLSATPYKMYTMHHECAEDDHYADFIRTTRFLFNSDEQTEVFRTELRCYRESLLSLNGQGPAALQQAKDQIERRLRQIMVRTERLASTLQRDAMIESITLPGLLTGQDLKAFATLDQVAQALEAGDMVEYWKSAPYILNLMEHHGYKIKQKFIDLLKQNPNSAAAQAIFEAFKTGQDTLLPWSTFQAYQPLDPGNAKLRSLLNQTIERGAWRLLWVPPSLPYYQPTTGPFADPALKDFTKALVFSSWQIVPKVITTLCSYEAERRMVTAYEQHVPDYKIEREKREARLVFNMDNGRPASMSNLALLYPCVTLATQLDPMMSSLELGQAGQAPIAEQILEHTSTQIARLLVPITKPYADMSGRTDERWYWAALALLDRRYHFQAVDTWFDDEGDLSWWDRVESRGDPTSSTNFVEHLALLDQYFTGDQDLGRPPDDLSQVLAKIALASPGVVALRSLLRFCPPVEQQQVSPATLAAALKVALGFRTLFNLPEVITLIRSLHTADEDTRYWESVLNYSLNGNVQAVLDEYMHILQEALGLMDKPADFIVRSLAEEVSTAISIRTASLNFDDIQVKQRVELSDDKKLRCRFALRFGNDKTEDNKEETRADQVRIAFNSPFHPFILATTSIGQEGLDFHQYCHEVYHWNLPSNPVDLEQREGRIHRYKGHVIRRNLTLDFSLADLADHISALADPWAELFKKARGRHPGKNELIPYWIYEPNNGQIGYKVRRHILALPLSRDTERLQNLRHTLVAYRMVFGQPRQEDLVNYLQARLDRDLTPDELLQFRIDLSPASWGSKEAV